MIKSILITTFFSLVSINACSSMAVSTPRLSVADNTSETRPQRGLLITEVLPDGSAEAAGLHAHDLITRYGEFEVIDDASFFTARNHYEQANARVAEIVLWRGPTRITAKVPPGRIGIKSVENDMPSKLFYSHMQSIDARLELPEYMMDKEFKSLAEKDPAEILEKAKAVIDQAERENTMTAAQIQVARIYMILDDASLEEQKRQSELLAQLIASQTTSFIVTLGSEKFFEKKRNRAAIACFKHYLKTAPEDVSIRLNLGVAYNRLGMYDEAAGAANYVFDNRLGLSDFGRYIGYSVKAKAALGRKDYRTCIEFAERAFSIDPQFNPFALIALAAAQTGSVRKVDEAIRRFEDSRPEKHAEFRLKIDAVRAYALTRANQRDAARQLVRQWKDSDRPEGRIRHYRRTVPDGLDVVRNWAELMGD